MTCFLLLLSIAFSISLTLGPARLKLVRFYCRGLSWYGTFPEKIMIIFLLVLFFFLQSTLEAEMDLHSKIWVSGHTGLVGSSIVRNLKAKGYDHLILKTHEELDLCDSRAVQAFYE